MEKIAQFFDALVIVFCILGGIVALAAMANTPVSGVAAAIFAFTYVYARIHGGESRTGF